MSKRITLRLSDDEHEEAIRLAGRETTGVENVSEFFRLLLKRESHKSQGKEKPTGKDFATAFRNGRPAKRDCRVYDSPAQETV